MKNDFRPSRRTSASRRAPAADARQPTLPSHPRPSADDRSPAQVIDEAFAALGGQLARVDQFCEGREQEANASSAASSDSPVHRPHQNQALVANVVTQLEALERQRQRLTQLLDDVDLPS